MKGPGVSYSFLKILTGSDLSTRRLAMMTASSGAAGPVAWLTACGHGDEVGGIVVIQEVMKRLRKTPLKRGGLFAFPLMNPEGFERGSRHMGIWKEDLNRGFPGDPRGALSERVAHRIFTAIADTGPDLVLDLHNDWIKSMPYALIDPPGSNGKARERAREAAALTGLVMVREREEEARELSGTLSGSLIESGIPALTLELGESFLVNEKNVARGVRAVWNVLAGMEMVEPEWSPLPETPESLAGRVLMYSPAPRASTSEIVRFAVKPGDLLGPGDPLARVYNVFGKKQETIAAPARSAGCSARTPRTGRTRRLLPPCKASAAGRLPGPGQRAGSAGSSGPRC